MCKNYTITPKTGRKQKQKYLCIIREKEHNTTQTQQRIIKANTQQTTHNTKKACNNTKREQTAQSVLCTHTKRRFIYVWINYTFATNKRNTRNENGLKCNYLDFPYCVRVSCTLLQVITLFCSHTGKMHKKRKMCNKCT